MAKATETTATAPKALDVLVSITDLVIPFRYPDRKVNLGDIARVVSSASRVLRFSDLDERIATENAAMLALAKRRGLVS